MTVAEIVVKYLQENGFDGLSSDECGCGLEDLMPCEFSQADCQPAKKFKCKGKDCERYDDCCGEVGDDCFRVKE